jgi:probable addiction module antidote protein
MKKSNKQKNTRKTSRKSNPPASTVDYMDYLLKDLQDPEYAAGYLTACWKEGNEVFLLGVRDVAQAQGGMSALAKAAKLNRQSVYGMLSPNGNPRFSSIIALIDKLGFKMKISVRRK